MRRKDLDLTVDSPIEHLRAIAAHQADRQIARCPDTADLRAEWDS